ncbi:phage tail tip lysozyme [Micrococcaceae bacterium Sec5.8]
MTFELLLDQKAAQMLASGFDPGPALGPVIAAGAGEYRLHQRAVITAHPSAGVHETHGLIGDRYFNRMDGPTGYLGYPASDETAAGAGRFNRFEFQGAAITWHPVFGVHEAHGLIGEYYWSALGGPAGAWGYPVSDEYPDGAASRSSDFEGGTLNWSAVNGVLEILAPVPGTVIPAGGDWVHTATEDRMRYVMGQLVLRYGYPVNAAAGIVGNLWAESGILPSRIEGSTEATPMRAATAAGVTTDFTAEQIMLRTNQAGPRLPGAGLAQWTSAARRAGMFTHVYSGSALGSNALFSMDAQIDYLVTELRTGFASVHGVLINAGVSVDAASDEMVYSFEVPGALLNGGQKLPRQDPQVQAVFSARRAPSRRARTAYGP